MGSVTIVIIATAIVANLRIIPSSSNAPALYDKIFEYAARLGIFAAGCEIERSQAISSYPEYSQAHSEMVSELLRVC